jgi:hypothetical protein
MANARKPALAAILTDAVFKNKMAALDLDSYSITEESYDALSWCDDCMEIAVVGKLRYGLRSCHGS